MRTQLDIQSSCSAGSPPVPSPLLGALEHVHKLARKQEIEPRAYKSKRMQRGIFSPSSLKPLLLEQTPVTLEHLQQVSDQIAAIQIWLRTHPDLLLVLDEALHREYRHTNRVALRMNVFLTLVGVLLGYVLPLAIQWLSLPR